MTKKIKETYAWAEEQEDYWEEIATKKIEQLNKITQSHLDWFGKHTTISDILAWGRPAVESTNENVHAQKNVIEKESTRSVNAVSLNRQDSISKMNDLPDKNILSDSKESKTVSENIEDDDEISSNHSTKSIDPPANEPTLQLYSEDALIKEDNSQHSVSPEVLEDKEINNFHIAPEFRTLFGKKDASDSITEIPLPEQPLVDSIVTGAIPSEPRIQNSGQSVTITDTIEDTRRTPELDTDGNTQSQKIPTTPKSYEDEDQPSSPCIASPIRKINNENDNHDDDDDEIRLVVSKRHFGDNVLSPVRNATNQYTNSSPIRTASEHYTNGSPNKNSTQLKSSTPTVSPARYQSPFMSRLFQLAQSSNSRDSKGSISSAHFITVRPKPSESSSTIASAKDNDIRMSFLENHAQKRPSELVGEPSTSTIEVSGVMPQPHFKKPRSMSLRKTHPASNIPTKTDDVVNEIAIHKEIVINSPIPSWARSPELYAHLKNQENIDPSSIFSAIPPLNLEDIFANPEIYRTQ